MARVNKPQCPIPGYLKIVPQKCNILIDTRLKAFIDESKISSVFRVFNGISISGNPALFKKRYNPKIKEAIRLGLRYLNKHSRQLVFNFFPIKTLVINFKLIENGIFLKIEGKAFPGDPGIETDDIFLLKAD